MCPKVSTTPTDTSCGSARKEEDVDFDSHPTSWCFRAWLVRNFAQDCSASPFFWESWVSFGAQGGLQKPVVREKEPTQRFPWAVPVGFSATGISARDSHVDQKEKTLFKFYLQYTSHVDCKEEALLDSRFSLCSGFASVNLCVCLCLSDCGDVSDCVCSVWCVACAWRVPRGVCVTCAVCGCVHGVSSV